MSKNLKQFTMSTKEDYLFVLQRLYINVYRYLEQYKRYGDEMVTMFSEYAEFKDGQIVHINNIPRYVYEDINNKLQNVSKDLILYIADDASDSMSYRIFRRLFNKKNNLGLTLVEDKDLDSELKELLNLRNWMFHNPQSLLVAEKEVFDKEKEVQEKEYLKNFPKELRPYLKPTMDYGLINIQYENYYEAEMFSSLFIHTNNRIKLFENILEKMKKDYSVILGKEVKVIETIQKTPFKLMGNTLAVANLSMAIQNRQYKGNNDEKYKEVTLKEERLSCIEE